MRLQGTTIEVRDLAAAKAFYETLLGLEPGEFYEPTKWQPYSVGDAYFAIREVPGCARHDALDITNFDVQDVEDLWNRVREPAHVLEPLDMTPYGTYKFVIADPSGYRLGFVGTKRS